MECPKGQIQRPVLAVSTGLVPAVGLPLHLLPTASFPGQGPTRFEFTGRATGLRFASCSPFRHVQISRGRTLSHFLAIISSILMEILSILVCWLENTLEDRRRLLKLLGRQAALNIFGTIKKSFQIFGVRIVSGS